MHLAKTSEDKFQLKLNEENVTIFYSLAGPPLHSEEGSGVIPYYYVNSGVVTRPCPIMLA